MFSGILFAQSMMVNRRRSDNEMQMTSKGRFDTSANDLDPEAGIKVTAEPERKSPVPVVYACATMWHETKNEMIQLLKSIFRQKIFLYFVFWTLKFFVFVLIIYLKCKIVYKIK